MSRYKDADALIATLHNTYLPDGDARSVVYATIENTPTADVVEVVRCKDCSKKEYCRTSNVWAFPPSHDWFCADGERREDAETVNTKN